MSEMADRLPLHAFGPRYYLLWLGASILRLFAFIGTWKRTEERSRILPSKVSQTRIRIPSREKGRTIKVDIYEDAQQSKDMKRYAHINFHGSGFVVPSLGEDLEFCAQLASTGTVVFDADYRKAPEHPFPAAFQDAQDVLSYVQKHGSDFDSGHLTIGGFSAGANIAMAIAVNSPPGALAGLVSIYGNPDMTMSYPAPDTTYDSGIVLPEWLRSFFYRCLILPGQERTDLRLSPVFAQLERWPKHVFFACGTADSLHDAGKVMVQRLKSAGHTDSEFFSVPQEAHGFDKRIKKGSLTEQRRGDMYRQAIEMVNRSHRSL